MIAQVKFTEQTKIVVNWPHVILALLALAAVVALIWWTVRRLRAAPKDG